LFTFGCDESADFFFTATAGIFYAFFFFFFFFFFLEFYLLLLFVKRYPKKRGDLSLFVVCFNQKEKINLSLFSLTSVCPRCSYILSLR